MTPAQLLEQLDAARQIAMTLPEGANIITLEVSDGGWGRSNFFHLYNSLQQMADAGAVDLKDATWYPFCPEDGTGSMKRSLKKNGFELFQLYNQEEYRKAAPGDSSTEDGTTGQGPTDNTNIINGDNMKSQGEIGGMK